MNDALGGHDRISWCQQHYGLSYHVPFAFQCQQMIELEGRDVLEVGGNLSQEFVRNELRPNSWTGMLSPDFVRQPDTVSSSEHPALHQSSGDYSTLFMNIENLPEVYHEKFDVIFSLACFEHIGQFPAALSAMYRALKSGGILWTMFSPIWSAYDGHHLPGMQDENGYIYDFKNAPIPPFGHLLMRPGQLYKHLLKAVSVSTAAEMTYHVYNSPHINRYFTEDYLDFVEQSRFSALRLEKYGVMDVPADIQSRLETACPGRKNFDNNGMLMCLLKR